jgi:hypothetical protein
MCHWRMRLTYHLLILGVPMDLNGGSSFKSGDWTHHRNFLDAVINAMDASLVNFTLWNYNPDNTKLHGDHWNGEMTRLIYRRGFLDLF